ncbi:MAG TPA: hypothetical protein G4O14_09525 [Anaerolineae bacterium]|nr:hypothetical protein [Anaerolineae bacterium]
MAEGSTGAGKSPHGFSEVGEGRGVGVEVGKAVGVDVGSSGMKGVAVEVAFGSAVTRGPIEADPPGMSAPGTQLQDAKIAQIAKRIGLAIKCDFKCRFNSDTIVIILLDAQQLGYVPVVPPFHDY